MTARRAQPEPLADLAGGALASLARTCWAWRLELALVIVLAIAYVLLQRAAGAPFAVSTLILVLLVGAVAARRRPSLRRPFHAARVRRDLMHALDADGAPHVRSVRRVPAGDLVTVRVARGRTVADLEQRTEQLAAGMRLHDVRVTRDRADASRATVLLMRRDPFDVAEPIAWPPLSTILDPDTNPTFSLWDPVPLGVDELGATVTLDLPGRNALIGGEPGSGKSVALSMLAAAAALDPTAGLWLLDGKSGVELSAWAPTANAFAYTTRDAIDVLRKLQAGIDARYAYLKSKGLRKVDRAEHHLHLLIVDELAYFTMDTTREREKAPTLGDEFSERLRDVVARGRAAGVITVLSTQKPSGDTVPTALRDLVGIRLALRCNTRDASDTILGRGYAAAGADASSIPAGQRGVGYLLDEAQPQRVCTYYLADPDLLAIAEHATSQRIDTETLQTTSTA